MSSELQPLPPDVLALLRKEHEAAPPSEEARARVRDRVNVSVGLAIATAGASLAVLRSSGKVAAAGKSSLLAGAIAKLAIGLTLGGLGATAYVAWHAHRHAHAPAPAIAPIAAPSVAPSNARVLDRPIDRTTAPAVIPTIDPPSLPAPHHRASEDASHLKEERVLLERARAALTAGNTSEALAAVERHAHRFPSGQLSEERECLRIRALAVSGDVEGAKRGAAAFSERYPNSMFQASACASP